MNKVYFSLGSNIGNRKVNLKKAIRLLISDKDTIQSTSYIYETEPWGKPGQRNFYNQAIELNTQLEPVELLEKLHRIEIICGRKPLREKYSPRTLDIDILFFNDMVLNTGSLKIPHPMLHLRRFVLVPMADIAPDFVHPVLGKTIRQLLAECEDELSVIRK